MQTRFSPVFALALVALGAFSCQKKDEPQPEPARVGMATATPPNDQPTPGAPGALAPVDPHSPDLAWDIPAAWQVVQSPAPMRKATYKIPKAGGDVEDAEMSVTQVGGDVDSNVKRWEGQFSSPDGGAIALKRTPRKVGDFKVTVVEGSGTFAGMRMAPGAAAGAKPGFAMLAAIVEFPAGDDAPQPYFFKLTGPEKTVNGARADFEKLVSSFRPKK